MAVGAEFPGEPYSSVSLAGGGGVAAASVGKEARKTCVSFFLSSSPDAPRPAPAPCPPPPAVLMEDLGRW